MLALFLPQLHYLPEVAAVDSPMAVLGWAYRWLFFRVMFGFGKQKFAGSSLRRAVALRPSLSPADKDATARLWRDFVPSLGPAELDWRPAVLSQLERRFGAVELRRIEEAREVLALTLASRLQPYRQGLCEPRLALGSSFHVSLLVHHLIGKGQDVFTQSRSAVSVRSRFFAT